MATPEPKQDNDWFATRTQVVVRAILALVLIGAYVAFVAFGVNTPEFLTGLVGLAAGFFLGAAKIA